MTHDLRLVAALAAVLLAGACSRPTRPEAALDTAKAAPNSKEPARFTQLYATKPNLPRGESGLVCYGVENAKSVWMEPPRQELSAALSRCVEVHPATTTTYTLSAQGSDGPPVKQQVTVTVGAALAHIVDVTVNSLSVARGDAVSVCFHARNATVVRVEPVHFVSPAAAGGCTIDHPQRDTTYVVTATGAGGDQDQEHVTVKVK